MNVYPAVEGPRAPPSGKTAPFKYDFSNGFDAAPLAEQLSNHTPVPIPYRAPINWTRMGSFAVMSLVFLVSLRFVLPVLQGRLFWVLMTVIPSLVFTGGLMFTQIRNSPWEMPNGQWMAAGYQNQYGKEVQMISIICMLRNFLLEPILTSLCRRWLGCLLLGVDPDYSLCFPCPPESSGICYRGRSSPHLLRTTEYFQVQKQRSVVPCSCYVLY